LRQALFDYECTVQELGALTDTTQTNASTWRCSSSRAAGARRGDGAFTCDRIADAALEQLCRLVCGSLAERHAVMRTHLAS
jgi:hypothetical protein